MNSTIAITGANRGIGLALCEAYLARGAKVWALCREASDELRASGAQIIDGIDLNGDEGFSRMQAALDGVQIDILINNAGILGNESLDALDCESVRRQFEINALAPLRVTQALRASLGKGAKIGFITSRMGSIADNGSGGYYGYRMSKAALNAAAMSLANDLRSSEIAVALLHPGFVQTRMVGFGGEVSALSAADGLVQRLDELTLANSGTFWHANGEVLPW